MGLAQRQDSVQVRISRFIVFIALIAVGSCRRSVPLGPLVVALPAGVGSVLPNTTTQMASLSVLSNVYETLVDLDPRLGVRPGLADSWYTPDDVTWVFRLREGVRLHDGKLLQSEDVVRSLEHARHDPASRRRGQLAEIASIEAKDSSTVEVRTVRPLDTLATRLSNVFVWAAAARPELPPAGTGPYRIGSWRSDGGAVLEAFEGYHRGPARIAEVVFEVVPQPNDRLQRLREGSAQLAADVVPAAARGGATPRIVSRADGLRVSILTFDVARERSPYASAGRNPFRDVRVRQAIALAIDRKALVSGVLAGRAAVAEQITTAQELGAYQASVPSRPFDLAGARRLLQSAGYGSGFEVVLDAADDVDSRAVAGAIAVDLRRIGVSVRARHQSEAELARRIEARDTALCLRSWTSETGDGRGSYECLLHTRAQGLGLANAGGYSSPALDGMVRDAAAPLGSDQRRMLLARLAAKVAIDVPLVPLYSMADVYAVVSRLWFEPRLDGQIRAAEMRWTAS